MGRRWPCRCEFRGMGPFGTFDTAGNVKEWTMNAAPTGERFILGGAWNESGYVFSAWDAGRRLPATRRSASAA